MPGRIDDRLYRDWLIGNQKIKTGYQNEVFLHAKIPHLEQKLKKNGGHLKKKNFYLKFFRTINDILRKKIPQNRKTAKNIHINSIVT